MKALIAWVVLLIASHCAATFVSAKNDAHSADSVSSTTPIAPAVEEITDSIVDAHITDASEWLLMVYARLIISMCK